MFAGIVTPPDYEPPGFIASDNPDITFTDAPMKIRIGDVSTVSLDTIWMDIYCNIFS